MRRGPTHWHTFTADSTHCVPRRGHLLSDNPNKVPNIIGSASDVKWLWRRGHQLRAVPMDNAAYDRGRHTSRRGLHNRVDKCC
jgi:hypothetical protein